MTDEQLVQFGQQHGHCLPSHLTTTEKASILRRIGNVHPPAPRWDIIIKRRIIF